MSLLRTRRGVLVVAAASCAIAAVCVIGIRTRQPSPSSPAETISGRVSCLSGQPVEGVWVAGQTDIGLWAEWKPVDASGSTADYKATIPASVEYQLRVGCGGSPQNWSKTITSAYTSELALALQCQDMPGSPRFGSCR
ncbi:hypothetical protein ABIA35_008114 [Catenulispora sp. MAP12-49]|uniref:hypothetical protein n=1 Tax=Catenulispora sp. MAP12-49 TaxID=3156302 RepID=UPI003516F113